MGDHSYINNGTHWLPHIWPFIFIPYISPKPLFLPKIVTQSPIFFSHCPEFWKLFTQRPLIGWNLRKRYPNVPYFYGFCHWKTPIFCLAYTWFVWGEYCSLKHSQKLENLTLYFHPLHQPQTPVFTKNCHPKSYFFHTVQNFGNFSLKDP